MSSLSRPERIVLERTFSQQDFDEFADLSGDDNPIHVDAEFAANSRFGRTVAHGVLLYTVARGLFAQLAPGALQRTQDLTFTAPTYADEPMRFTAWVLDRDDQGVTVALEITRIGDGETTCTGRSRLAFGSGGDA